MKVGHCQDFIAESGFIAAFFLKEFLLLFFTLIPSSLALVKSGQYTPFPHRNVMVGDLIGAPEEACIHSWGMDILYLLQEYLIGKSQKVSIFNSSNPWALSMEQEIRSRVIKKLKSQTVSADLGKKVFEEVVDSAAKLANTGLPNPMKFEERMGLLKQLLSDFATHTAHYTNPEVQLSLFDFHNFALTIGSGLAHKCKSDNHFIRELGKELTQFAHTRFTHQDKILRMIADCIFIPLNLPTLGLLSVVKKLMTGSFFYSTAQTHREQVLETTLENYQLGSALIGK